MSNVTQAEPRRVRLAQMVAAVALACSSGLASAQQVSGTIKQDGVEQGTPQSGTSISDSIRTGAASASYIGDASTGVFNVRAAHSGAPGTAESSITFTQSLFNELDVAQDISFSFHVFAGEIGARSGRGISGASFAASIDWGGDSVWHTRLDIENGRFSVPSERKATIDNSPSAPDFVYSISGDSTYIGSWDAYSKTLGLGILNPGESKTLSYTMSTVAYAGPGNMAGYGGGSIGFGGDPLSFSRSPLPAGITTGMSSVAAPVPEPSTYAMLGVGLATLALGARRRSRRAKPVG